MESSRFRLVISPTEVPGLSKPNGAQEAQYQIFLDIISSGWKPNKSKRIIKTTKAKGTRLTAMLTADLVQVFLQELKRADAIFALGKFSFPVTVHTPVGDQYIVFSDCTVWVKEDVVLGVFPMESSRRYHVLFSRKVVQLVGKTWNDYRQEIDVIWDLVMDRYFLYFYYFTLQLV